MDGGESVTELDTENGNNGKPYEYFTSVNT